MASPRRISSLKFVVVTRARAVTLFVAAVALGASQLVLESPRVDRALYTVGGGLVAASALWFLGVGYTPLVLDAGDALLVGRKRRRIPLDRVTSVVHKVPAMRGGRVYTEIITPAYPGGSFGYVPRDVVTGLTSVPEPKSTTDLRARVERARASRPITPGSGERHDAR